MEENLFEVGGGRRWGLRAGGRREIGVGAWVVFAMMTPDDTG
jgi:hypothetical protein